MARLLEERQPSYRQADLKVQTGARPPSKVAWEIAELLGLE